MGPTHYTAKKCWQHVQLVQGVHVNQSVRQRAIVVQAGGEMGFIYGAELIYDSKSQSADYHDEMNDENYNKWLKEHLIPNLPSECSVVLDNASNHTVQENNVPAMACRKADTILCFEINDRTINKRNHKEDWIKCCQSVEHIEDEYWRRDALMEEEVERIVINIGIVNSDEECDEDEMDYDGPDISTGRSGGLAVAMRTIGSKLLIQQYLYQILGYRLFSVDGIDDSEMVYGEMRRRIRKRLSDIRLTIGETSEKINQEISSSEN
ncbi:hypothetical protein ANN_26102 [Periplaneta americana]|uniref:Tc1-like transposase DDE domain-containing protein n=1 Tax=Periplaneta americana TaxID=6978 RepID=A0ABQ8S506_PERAM|nr:hypothetical protein ANN_26102 [Periplaneta americana]